MKSGRRHRLEFLLPLLALPWSCSRPSSGPPAEKVALPASAPAGAGSAPAVVALSSKESLGRRIFFDTSLSDPAGQSCAACHAPETGFADPEHRAVSEGAAQGRFGNRNAPTVAYAGYVPRRQFDAAKRKWKGGLFHDGRTDSLAAQSEGPFLNPLEMANAGVSAASARMRRAAWWPDLVALYGAEATSDPTGAFRAACDAIAAYERSAEVNPFSSKFDAWMAGKAELSASEAQGLALFNDQAKGNCRACHPMTPDPASGKVLFTDFTYENLGAPRNLANPFYRELRLNPARGAWRDRGLGADLKEPSEDGKFRAPTLRNVGVTAPYLHNGSLATLEEIIRFYNRRDVKAAGFPAPEVPRNVNRKEMGNLGLSDDEERNLVAFLKTLTDGYRRPGS